jgi:starch phosphorylase
MSHHAQRPHTPLADTHGNLKDDMLRHIQASMGRDPYAPDRFACYTALALSLRDRLVEKWLRTQRALYETPRKRVYFLSLEFLPGRFLKNYLISMGMMSAAQQALSDWGHDLDDIEEEEWDAGLGNGGLGRLASCFMDAVACNNLPVYGYGIRYDYGIFHQIIENGYQKEQSDNWMRRGNPWEIQRLRSETVIQYYGHTETYQDSGGRTRWRWVGGETVVAMPHDILIPGYGDDYVTNMRLWSASSSREFDLSEFNQGDYIGAVEAKVLSETISKVLYPSDEGEAGKTLRLKQQYFFVAATLWDILRRFRKQQSDFTTLPDLVAIQLNDTHPAIAVAELMRLLVDGEGLAWEVAWRICNGVFAYTNHTVLPEALETWPVDLLGKLLPRHLEIIFEINHRFLEEIRVRYPDEPDLPGNLSIIAEGTQRRVRMAHLAIIASHAVNGVAELHSKILRTRLFADFNRVFPGKFTNVTNGVSPRRWLKQANPSLAALITEHIGDGWICDLDRLKDLVPLAEDPGFRSAWRRIRRENKRHLARYVRRKIQLEIAPDSLFDVHVKRIHEYKRQILNLLHVITLYNRIKSDPARNVVPRTFIFAGKAAPAYHQAKRIIKLITAVADVVNTDPDVDGRLRVAFLPNYCVSQAEKIIPAADLSEQISTAGMEASGTGNMKMSLNGALTIGTLDGANIEIMEAVGRENIFLFGLTAADVAGMRSRGYRPRYFYDNDSELRQALDMIGDGAFCPDEPELFQPILRSLFHLGNDSDHYLVLADYRPFVTAQEAVSRLYQDPDAWTRRSIVNTACMGKFSSDRSVLDYAGAIWNVQPVD